MISKITQDDYREVLTLLIRCVKEVNETGFVFKYNKYTLLDLLRKGVEIDDYTECLKFMEKDKIVGIGIITVSPMPWEGDKLVAHEVAWHSDPLLPSHQRAYVMAELYEEMEAWAINYGANYMRMSVSMDERLKSVVRFFERRGYVKDSFAMLKEVG